VCWLLIVYYLVVPVYVWRWWRSERRAAKDLALEPRRRERMARHREALRAAGYTDDWLS